MTDHVLHLRDIVVRAAGKVILSAPDFAVTQRDVVALVGPNGAGKSTLLHVAALLRRPDQGTVAIQAQAATPENAAQLRRAISVVFQQPLLFNVSVLENAAAGVRFQGRPRAAATGTALTWLGRFGVAHLAQRRARGLSGGEAARVALARAFATSPTILMLDEPFSSLDAPTRAALLPDLRAMLRASGTAALLVTHDLADAFAVADRLALLDAGAILATGSAPALLANPATRRVAELLGIETILPVTVRRVGEHAVVVALSPDGPEVQVSVREGEFLPGSQATLTLPAAAARAIRPGSPCPADWNAIPGQVTDITTLPTGTRLRLTTPAPLTAWAAWDPRGCSWTVGDAALVTFSPDGAHLIPAR